MLVAGLVLLTFVAFLDVELVLLVAGFAATEPLLYAPLLLLEVVVALPRFSEAGLALASAVVTFLLDLTTALSPLFAVCVYLLCTFP